MNFNWRLAETLELIVQPASDRAYTMFAESMDRSGFVRCTMRGYGPVAGGAREFTMQGAFASPRPRTFTPGTLPSFQRIAPPAGLPRFRY